MNSQPADCLSLNLLESVHIGLPLPGDVIDKHFITGNYRYYHYLCDKVDDRGWGCGYRSLQTIMSWLELQEKAAGKITVVKPVVTLREIQEALVAMGDKPSSFVGSRDWIGSVEIAMCIDFFYNIPCKIIHVLNGAELELHIDAIECHFQEKGAPIMMGGDIDASSKCILGTCRTSDNIYLLILDPHFSGNRISSQNLQDDGWVKWRALDTFQTRSFYNLCLPQYTATSV